MFPCSQAKGLYKDFNWLEIQKVLIFFLLFKRNSFKSFIFTSTQIGFRAGFRFSFPFPWTNVKNLQPFSGLWTVQQMEACKMWFSLCSGCLKRKRIFLVDLKMMKNLLLVVATFLIICLTLAESKVAHSKTQNRKLQVSVKMLLMVNKATLADQNWPGFLL